MEIRALRSLVSLAETGSLRRTAAAMHLSPAAVHKQLKTLQEETGVVMYERFRRRLRPSPGAELILPYVHNLLAQHEAALAALAEWKGLGRGSVRIGAGPTIASYLLPALLRAFRRRYPKIELSLETGSTGTLQTALDTGDIDLAFLVASAIGQQTIIVHRRWEFEIVLVANSRSPLRRCALQDLGHEPFILFKPGSRIQEAVDRYFAEQRFEPRAVMRLDNAEVIKCLVGTGIGLSLLPYWTVAGELSRGSIRIIHLKNRPLLANVELISRPDRFVPRPVEVFLQLAQAFEFGRLRHRGEPRCCRSCEKQATLTAGD